MSDTTASPCHRPGPRARRPAALLLALGLCAFAPLLQAQGSVVQALVIDDRAGKPAADAGLPNDLAATLQHQLERIALDSSQGAVPGVQRVEIEVGQLDPRLRLAPCQRVEPYLPQGTRLWGKARIGLRCTQGPSLWNVYLPITVKVFGPAWVAAQTLAAGAVLSPGDLVQADVDWAAEASPTITDPEQAVGRTLLRRVTAGQGLRQIDLRPRQWFAAGDQVKVVAVGRGFAISSSGQALSHGIEGQSVRVRTENGRVVSGSPAGDRRVEIRL